MPALSIDGTSLMSTIRCRLPRRNSCWMSFSNASAAPPATRGTWGDRTIRSAGRLLGTSAGVPELYTGGARLRERDRTAAPSRVGDHDQVIPFLPAEARSGLYGPDHGAASKHLVE